MADCCGDHSKQESSKKKGEVLEQPPKSFVGKYLYNLGKKEVEKEKQSGKHKGGCC